MKLCKDCKHVDNTGYTATLSFFYWKCLKTKIEEINLVNGEVNVSMHYCNTCREETRLCGPEAKNFEPNEDSLAKDIEIEPTKTAFEPNEDSLAKDIEIEPTKTAFEPNEDSLAKDSKFYGYSTFSKCNTMNKYKSLAWEWWEYTFYTIVIIIICILLYGPKFYYSLETTQNPKNIILEKENHE